MAEDGWQQHDALPLLRSRSGRWLADGMVIETREPKARNVFWCSSWPHPDGSPPDSFVFDHCPPASFNGPALAPPDLVVKVAASRSQPLAAAFVSVHTSLLSNLPVYLNPPFTLPSSPYSYVTKPPPLFLSSLLSLLTWVYTSNTLVSRVDAHSHICCIDDLAFVHRIASLLRIRPVLYALSREPFISLIERFNQSQLEQASSRGRLHGFVLTPGDMNNFYMLFFDTIGMPCRTKFLQEGVLIVDRSAMFILDMSKIIVPRRDACGRRMRSYCILVPKDFSSLAIYSFLSHCQFLTLHARVDNQEISLRRSLDSIALVETVSIAFTRSTTDGVPSSNDMEYIKFIAEGDNLGADKLALTFEDEGETIKYSGTFDNIVAFLKNLLENAKSLRRLPATLMIQRVSFKHFTWIFGAGLVDDYYFDSTRNVLVIKDALLVHLCVLTNVQEGLLMDLPERELQPRIIETCLDELLCPM